MMLDFWKGPRVRRLITKIQSFSRAKIILSAVWLCVLLIGGVYLEVPHETGSGEQQCQLMEKADTETSAATYSRIVAGGYRRVRSRRVTVITLDDEIDPPTVMNNVCEQRSYLAKLLQQLSSAGAAVIVVDKYFGSESCNKNDKNTAELIAAVKASSVPIVVGMATHAPKSPKANSCLVVTNSLDFGQKARSSAQPPAPEVSQGLTRLNADVRKVPLNWFVYRSDKSFAAGDAPVDNEFETLSFQAASLVDPGLKDDRDLRDLRAADRHPFTSFIAPDALQQANAAAVLCSGSYRQQMHDRYSIDCAAHPFDAASIRGQILVVGESSGARDRHRLFDNDVPGVYLQANYIESLLDDRYFKPVPRAVDFGLFVAWLVFVYVIFWSPMAPWKSLLVSVAVGLTILLAIMVAAFVKGYYPVLGVQVLGVVALILRYVEVRGHKLAEEIVKGSTAKEPEVLVPAAPADQRRQA